MSVEGSTLESNSRKERKLRQLFALKLLLKDRIPYELKRDFLRGKNRVGLNNRYILDKGTENAITFFKGKSIVEENIVTELIYVSELDLRKSTGAYMMDMDRYFPEEKLHIIDVTYKGVGEDEIFSILRFQNVDDSRIVMVRDQQKEYEEDMHDEFYYFLIEFDI